MLFGKYRRVKQIIAHAALISLAVAFLWHFKNIWIYGEHLITEPNQVILLGETIGLIGLLIFGTKCLIDEVRKWRV